MNKTIVWIVIVTIIVLLFLGMGVSISLKLKKPSITIGDLERECLMKKAVENCFSQTKGYGVFSIDIYNFSYICNPNCCPCCPRCKNPASFDKFNFTEQEIDKCNLTKWMESG